MRWVRHACAIAAVVVTAGCQSSGGASLSDRFGDCTIRPRTVCTNQNLAALSLNGSDLTGADFTDSDMNHADLHNAILRDAKLVNANLVGVDLTGADLRGADLSGAALFIARLEKADWANSIRTGTRFCETVLPDGTMSDCPELNPSVPIVAPKPPSIEVFAVHRPLRCLDDGIGQGFEMDWKVRRATNVAFLIDDIRASTASGSHGVQRLPIKCDNGSHVVTIQAFGATPPPALKSVTVAVGPNTTADS